MISWISAKAILFLVFSIVGGQLLAPRLSKIFAKIQTGVGMKFSLAISFGPVFAFLAQKIGLAPIVGAFAAGLVLDPIHFSYFKDPQIVDDIRNATAGLDKNAKDTLKILLNHTPSITLKI